MITKKTAYEIWVCYSEIEKGENLAQEITQALRDRKEPDLRDVFGDRHNLQLGIPHGENGHRLFDVKPELAVCVITAHINDKRAKLIALMIIAQQELQSQGVAGASPFQK